jgi:hypothetical protein
VLLRFLFAESDVDGPGQGSPCQHRDGMYVRIWEKEFMTTSSSVVASSAVVILSTALLCSLTGAAMSQTEPRVGGGTLLPNVVVGAPKQLDRPTKPRQGAVARSTVSSRTSIASASDPPVYGRVTLATTTGNCSTTTWPTVSPVQCTKPFAKNYVECTELVTRNGSKSSDAWWWCSNQGFKN